MNCIKNFVRVNRLSVDSAESLINNMFFDVRRYDLAKVGRYKFNKKLSFTNRIVGFALAEDAVSPETGEVVAEAGTMVSEELAREIQNAAIPLCNDADRRRTCCKSIVQYDG